MKILHSGVVDKLCHPFRMFLISHLSCLFLNRKLLKMFNNERLTDLIMLVLDGAG